MRDVYSHVTPEEYKKCSIPVKQELFFIYINCTDKNTTVPVTMLESMSIAVRSILLAINKRIVLILRTPPQVLAVIYSRGFTSYGSKTIRPKPFTVTGIVVSFLMSYIIMLTQILWKIMEFACSLFSIVFQSVLSNLFGVLCCFFYKGESIMMVLNVFQVERGQCDYLLIHSGDDQSMTPIATERIPKRLEHNHKSNYGVLMYPEAGHLIEPPYSPHFYSTYHSLFSKYYSFCSDLWKDMKR